jgi:hypothetical protein
VELLRTLTAAYGAALALLLAGGLAMVAVYLVRIGAALADARAAMVDVVDETQALEEHLGRLRDASGVWAEELAVARPRIVRADRMMATLGSGRARPALAPRRRGWVSRLFGG